MTRQGTAERVVRFLVDHARCTDCACSFHVEDVHVLAHDAERVWDLAAVCHNCYTMSLIRAVVRDQDGRVRTRVMRELTPAEARRFERLPPVDVDDVLDVAAFLADFDGDFRELFGREPDPS